MWGVLTATSPQGATCPSGTPPYHVLSLLPLHGSGLPLLSPLNFCALPGFLVVPNCRDPGMGRGLPWTFETDKLGTSDPID